MVFHFAREEGQKLGHALIGPEHLLLGLLREGGAAGRVLADVGVTLSDARRLTEELSGRGTGANDEPAITAQAGRVMERAGLEAERSGSRRVRTEHILLAILGEGDGTGYLSFGHTQKTYFGVGGSYVTSSAYASVPLLSLQVGGPTAPEFGGLELRAAFDTVLLFSNLGVDALASVRLPDASLRLYFGGGPDVLVLVTGHPPPGREGTQVFFGAHGTAGLEFLGASSRLFAELQPEAAFIYGEPVVGLELRAGVNFDL